MLSPRNAYRQTRSTGEHADRRRLGSLRGMEGSLVARATDGPARRRDKPIFLDDRSSHSSRTARRQIR